MPAGKPAVPAWAVGEFAGTFMLVFFGCGSVAAAVLTGAQVGIFQVAIVWGLGIATAIHLTGSLSGAHLNPAVTLSLAAAGRLPLLRAPGYILMQMMGAFSASAVLYALFAGPLRAFEAANRIVRGAPGSEASAMIFGEFYPNPAWHAAAAGNGIVSQGAAFLAEAGWDAAAWVLTLPVSIALSGSLSSPKTSCCHSV